MIDTNFDKLTVAQAGELLRMFLNLDPNPFKEQHPVIGRRCVIRTYTAGVHIGTVVAKHGTEVILNEPLRLWKWQGALSLSAVALTGITGGRLQRSPDGTLVTQAIEILPCTPEAETTYARFIE